MEKESVEKNMHEKELEKKYKTQLDSSKNTWKLGQLFKSRIYTTVYHFTQLSKEQCCSFS